MTRAERALAANWRTVALLCWLLALSGALVIGWSYYSRLADEADRRGDAVNTLAGDVRILRAQVKDAGETPRAPDPSDAVDNLDDRTRVPVTGPRGPKGDPGQDAPTLTPSPGASGKPGRNGADSTVPGPQGSPGNDSNVSGPTGPPGAAGQDGKDGKDGTDGKDGAEGKPPAGWTFDYGGASYTCRPVDDFDPVSPRYACDAPAESPAPPDDGSQLPSPLAAALDPTRREYA
ncbi:collagen-like protein [Streptomyces sp. NPDC051362]|uniref:collagen-like protein n=1 Tax=Streptomyces sp. NPDC051362 TaxID=3365651 RepID=UPI0037B373A5